MFEADPLPVFNFRSLRFRCTVKLTDEDMIEFMFDQLIIKVRFVNKDERLAQLAREIHLLLQPSLCRRFGCFARTRVSATGI